MVHEQSKFPLSASNKNKEAEKRLLQKIAEGDRIAYTQMYTQYLPKIYQFIYRFTHQSKEITEEIVQDVFLSIWEKKETLVAVQNFDSYVFKIAKNKVLNSIKHQAFKDHLHQSFSQTLDTKHVNTESSIVYAEYHQTAIDAIKNLPEKRRIVFLLSTQVGLSLDEIAQKLGISKSRVKQQLYEAKDYIKQYLHKNAEWLIAIAIYFK
ncbi:MAG: RNA polymerase sigma factor [Chitinophagaceae bacterium]